MAIRTFIPRGGTGLQLQLFRLLPHLEERGVATTILAGGTRRRLRNLDPSGAEIRRSPIPGNSSLASAAYVARSLMHLVHRRRQIDVLHAHGALDPGAIALGAMRLGIPAIVKITRTGSNKSDFIDLLHRPGGAYQARRLIERAWFIATTSLVKKDLVERGVPEERILSIPNGVDTRRFAPPTDAEKSALRAQIGIGNNPLVVSTSRLADVKQLHIAIEAVSSVPDTHMLVLGGGSDKQRLREVATRTGASDRIHFVGSRRNVEDYLRAADIFVLPSGAEGMSNSLLEAMSCGLACVVSNVLDVPELFAEERGAVVGTDHPDAWRDSVWGLVREPDRRARIGDKAARHVRTHFTLERTADKLVDAYRHVKNERSRT